MLNDLAIRTVLDSQLSKRFAADPDVTIRHELGVESGNRRVDVAVLNGHLAGWEIKSDEDTLSRLPDQAQSFGRVMDYLTIVTTERYLAKCETILPGWWGLTQAIDGPSGVKLIRRRAPRINRLTDPFSMAQLLWREEVMDELRSRGCARGLSGRSRYFVWERLAETLSKRELRSVVLQRLKQRHEWSGGQLRIQGADSSHK